MMQIRHGDVLLVQVEASECKGNSTTDRLLAEGEGHNHGHVIEGDVSIYRNGDDRFTTHFLEVKKGATLKHVLIDRGVWTGEHTDILVPPGTYKVVKQREYDPYEQKVREVND
jgi:hypothetical protein